MPSTPSSDPHTAISAKFRDARAHLDALSRIVGEVQALTTAAPARAPTLTMPDIGGDNFRVIVTSEMKDRVRFDLAFQMALRRYTITHHAVTPFGLLFCWSAESAGERGYYWTKDPQGLPGVHIQESRFVDYRLVEQPMSAEEARDFAWSYLETVPRTDDFNDDDVTEHHGWTVTTGDQWNHIGPHRYGILMVMPSNTWYGK